MVFVLDTALLIEWVTKAYLLRAYTTPNTEVCGIVLKLRSDRMDYTFDCFMPPVRLQLKIRKKIPVQLERGLSKNTVNKAERIRLAKPNVELTDNVE